MFHCNFCGAEREMEMMEKDQDKNQDKSEARSFLSEQDSEARSFLSWCLLR